MRKFIFLWLIPCFAFYLIGGYTGFKIGVSPQVRGLIAAKEASQNIPSKISEFFGGK
jgi:hypothetical protein